VVPPLEHRRGLRLVPLAHHREWGQEDPDPGPDPWSRSMSFYGDTHLSSQHRLVILGPASNIIISL
jgi:hypothetical protein